MLESHEIAQLHHLRFDGIFPGQEIERFVHQEEFLVPVRCGYFGLGVHAATDVTGFGLIGHAREMVLASDVAISISAGRVPLIEGAIECVRAGHIPGGLKNNRDFAECLVEYDDGVPEDVRALLFDPQTAGGLLISTPDGTSLGNALRAAGVPAVEIGQVMPNAKPRIRVSR